MKLKTLENNELREWVAGLLESDGTIASYYIDHKFGNWSIEPRVSIVGAYYSGLIDGDGWISSNIKKTPFTKIGFRIDSIVGYCGNDATININRLKQFCKKYNINYTLGVRKRDEISTPLYRFCINGREDCKKFLDVISQYLGYKKIQALIWLKEIYPKLKKGIHLEKEGFLDTMYYLSMLYKFKGKNAPIKYDIPFFLNLWGYKDAEINISKEFWGKVKEKPSQFVNKALEFYFKNKPKVKGGKRKK